MEAYATPEDLAAGWRALTPSEAASAETLLMRASAFLAGQLAAAHVAIDPEDEVQALNLATVCCDLVRDAFLAFGRDGAASMSQTVGSTSASVSWGGTYAGFNLTQAQRTMLGLAGGGRFAWLQLGGGRDDS